MIGDVSVGTAPWVSNASTVCVASLRIRSASSEADAQDNESLLAVTLWQLFDDNTDVKQRLGLWHRLLMASHGTIGNVRNKNQRATSLWFWHACRCALSKPFQNYLLKTKLREQRYNHRRRRRCRCQQQQKAQKTAHTLKRTDRALSMRITRRSYYGPSRRRWLATMNVWRSMRQSFGDRWGL